VAYNNGILALILKPQDFPKARSCWLALLRIQEDGGMIGDVFVFCECVIVDTHMCVSEREREREKEVGCCQVGQWATLICIV
jgi:hypothetical protein